MNRTTYSNWKLGKSQSYLKKLDEIALFFSVSPGYILRGIEDGPSSRSASEDELLRLYRELDPHWQELMLQIGRILIGK